MKNEITKGSITDMARRSNLPVSTVMTGVKLIVMVDSSSSMSTSDDGDLSRYEIAKNELAKLQSMHEGKVGVISFSSEATFCLGGIPKEPYGGTDLIKALMMASPLDEIDGMGFAIISDGETRDEKECLDFAMNMRNKINTIFVGRNGGAGQYLMVKIAENSGGRHVTDDTAVAYELVQSLFAPPSEGT